MEKNNQNSNKMKKTFTFLFLFTLFNLLSFAQEIGTNDFRISYVTDTDVTYDANNSDVAYNSDDDEFLVVYRASNTSKSDYQVLGQRIDASNGNALGSSFVISGISLVDNSFNPKVAYDNTNKQYAVVWSAYTTEFEVYLQRLNSDGTEIGVDTKISDMVHAEYPEIVYNSNDDEFLVVWEGRKTGSYNEIFGQRITAASGAEVGTDDFIISTMGTNSTDSYIAKESKVKYNPTNNEYLVVWQGEDNTGSLVDGEYEIFGQRLNASTGAEVGSDDFRISTTGTDGVSSIDAYNPSLIYNSTENEFLVVWRGEGQANSVNEVYGQRLDASDGSEIGSDFKISDMGSDDSSTDFEVSYPGLAYDTENNTYLVIWLGDDDTSPLVDDEYEIFGQVIDGSDGSEIGVDERLSDVGVDGNTDTGASDGNIAYSTTSKKFLVVWEADEVNSQTEVYGQFYTTPSSNAAPTATAPSAPTVLEDATNVALADNIQVADDDADDTQKVTFAITGGKLISGISGINFGGDGNGSSSFTIEGTLNAINNALDAATFTPTENLNGVGAGTIAFTTNDGTTYSNTASVSFDIIPVNDEPSFTIGANQTVAQNAGAQTVNGFATDIADGDGGSQTVSFNVSNDNISLFTAQPAISSLGVLTYTPDASKFGKATITVSLSDDGGDTNGGDDQSPDQTFTIFVTPTAILINEVNCTPSDEEFVELYNSSGSTIALDGLVLVCFNGGAANNSSYKTAIDMDGQTLAAGAYLVIGDAGVANQDIGWSSTDIQDGPDAVALFVGDQSDFPSPTDATADGLVDAIVYHTGQADDTDLINLLTPGQIQVNENSDSDKAGQSSQRIPNGTGGLRNTSAYQQHSPTPGERNNVAPTASDFTATSIYKGIPYVFSTDFGYSDVDEDDMVKIAVNLVPSEGILYLDEDNGDDYDAGEELSNGANVSKADLDNGNLQYYNDTGTNSFFEFAVYDGTVYSASTYTATLNIIAFPTVTTQAVSSITATTATGNGNIIDLGIPNPTAHGVCWSTSENPTTAGSKDDKGAASEPGAFTASITGLSAGTTYYVRAFATNDAGTVYGSQVSFKTNTPPTVSNRTFNDIHKGNVYPNLSNVFLDYVDADSDDLQNIRISALPGNGTLFYDQNNYGTIDDGEVITVNQEIPRDSIIWGYLKYLNTDGVSSSFTYEASDGSDYSNTAAVTLTVNPTPRVTFTTIAQTISEATETITIIAQLSEVLNYTAVTVPFSVDVSSTATGGGEDFSISGSPITIEAGLSYQIINITVNNDDLDEPEESVVVNMGEPTNAAKGTTTTFTANIIDDDPAPTVAFNTSSSEGLESTSSVDLQVDLSAASGFSISVDYTVSGTATRTGADCTLADGILNFDVGETSKNITIASIVDNLLDEDNETVIVSLSSPTNAGLGDNTVHTYTIKDDDPTPTVEFTSASSNGLESVSSADLQVDLSAESGLEVKVDYAVTGTATGADFTLANGNLAIVAGNANNNITIASIVNDYLDESNETVIVTLSNPMNATLGTNTEHIYTITDDDTVGFTIAESAGSTSVGEFNGTDTFTAVLDAQPTSDVVLNVSSGDTGEATVDKATLTFTNANWNVSQEVTVTAVDDNLIDGNQNTNITISVDDDNSENTFDALADKMVNVTTTDDDVAGFTISESDGNTLVVESGTDDSFTVVLDAQPTSDVVLNIAEGSTDEATLDKTTLTFTSENWNTAQTITITPIDDDFDDGNQFITLIVSIDDDSSDNDFDPVADQTVSVTSTDDDTAGFTLTKTNTSVAESGTSDSFIVSLDAKPSSNVVLNVASGDESEITVSSATFIFTTENWNVGQTVNLTGIDDAFADGNKTTTITISVDDTNSDDVFDPVVNQTVSCITSDDEEVGFTLTESDGSTLVWEAGATTTDDFTVVLDGPPESDVVLSIVSGDTGEATVSASSLTFTNADWNTAQTVTVTGVNDVAGDGSQTTAITISVNDGSSDDAFDALVDQIVEVTTVDEDSPGITVTETDGTSIVDENGGIIEQLKIVLNKAPDSDVVLSLSSADLDEIIFQYYTCTFTPTNWDKTQTFLFKGMIDNVVDGDITVPLTISVDDENSDNAWDNLDDIIINAVNQDKDVASYTVSKSFITVDETGTTESFTVVLDAKPLSDVVFNVSSGDTDEATVDQSTLTFTLDDWNSAQTVNVTGVNDDLADGIQTSMVTISVDADSSQDEFDDLADKTVSVTTRDDDANFTLSKTTASVAESGTTDEFTVVLNGAPSSDVVLSVTSGDTGESTIDHTSLTFTSVNWSTPQTVTLTGVDDDIDDGNQSTAITLSVNAASSDDPFDLVSDKILNVITEDDDTTPVVTASQSFDIAEDIANSGVVGTALATDADAGTSFSGWTESGGTGAAIFEINSGTGAITVTDNSSIDYETTTSYTYTVSVSDGTNTSAIETITINITDENDVKPVITASQTFNIDEDEPNTTSIGTVLATDGDVTATTFSSWTIAAGNTNSVFAINSSTGELTVNDANELDYETTTSYTLTLSVSDGTNTSATETIVVEVNPINDNNPVVTVSQSFDIVEDIANGGVVGTALATDADAGTSFSSWTETGGTGAAIFEINSGTGAITVTDNSSIDYETTTSYTYSVSVSDGTNTSVIETITINIIDENDVKPVITASQTFNIDEDEPNTTSIGTVLATDGDVTATTFSSWAIAAGNTNSVFAINSSTGELTVNDANELDYETLTNYTLTLRVSDGTNTSATETIVVEVNPINDNNPVVVASQSFDIAEDIANGGVVGTALATDADAGTSFSSWTETGGTGAAIFEINASTGAITVTDNLSIDYETTTLYTYTVSVSDGTNTSAIETITINITDENDVKPVITASQTFNIDEDEPNTSSVGTVQATDGDVTATTLSSWTITGGNTNSVFAINSSTGELTVNDVNELDYETTTSYTLTLRVSDGTNTSATETIVVDVNPINDNNPVVIASQSFDIAEDIATGGVVGTVFATDVDSGTTYSSWSITGGNDDAIFTINPTSGEITVADNSNLDFESTTSYTLSVTVSDGVNTSMVESVSVNVNDVNDEVPVIIASQSFSVKEDADNNTSVGSVLVSDADAGTTYSSWTIIGGNDDAIFAISPTGGEIFIDDNSHLSFMSAEVYNLSIHVSDGLNVSQTEYVTVNIINVNNNAPVITPNQKFTISEDATNTTIIGRVLASDADVATFYSNWTIVSGNEDAVFSIHSGSGEISVEDNSNLDFESTSVYILGISVSDGLHTSSVETVRIDVEDINDEAPIVVASQSFSLKEDAANNTSLGIVSFTDGDAGTVFSACIISSGNDDKMFAIHPTTGNLSIVDNSKLDFELKDRFIIGVCVSDGMQISKEVEVMILVRDVNERPIANAGENQLVAENTKVTLNAWQSVDPEDVELSFKWSVPEGIELSSEFEAVPIFIAPEVSTLTDFVFTLIVDDGELYSEESSVVISVDNVTGIEEVDSDEAKVSLYPNPSKGAFYLELNKRPVDPATLSIISSSGQLAYSQKLYEKKTYFNLSLKSGMYLLKIGLDDKVIMRKIIINQD